MRDADADVLGLRMGREIVCAECATNDENVEAKQSELILSADVSRHAEDGVRFYCDRCQELLS